MSDLGVAKLKRRAKRYAKPDTELRGHWIRVQPSGSKSFWTVARDPKQKQVWTFVGPCDAMTIEEARAKARGILNRVRAGLPAIETKGETFDTVIADWHKRYVEGKKLRTGDKMLALLNRHVSAELRSRVFTEIHREDITALLDKVEDESGAPVADKLLTVVGSIMGWYATRHRNYVPPLVKGMRRTDSAKKERDRILSDDELRRVWNVAGQQSTYGAFVKALLLTVQRADKVLSMRWEDVDADGVWTIPTAAREKGNIGKVRLPPAAVAILNALPRFADNPHIFAGRGQRHMSASGMFKAKFDAKLPSGMPNWRLHDLRRTARSLMSRAGVSSEHAERVMGHAIGGVEGIYDRHAYFDEKSAALAKLNLMIDGIINPRVVSQFTHMRRGNAGTQRSDPQISRTEMSVDEAAALMAKR
jgi:integrase